MGAKISYGQVFIIILAFVLMYGLWVFVNSTKLGKAMRATAQNRTMARILGINIDKTIRVTFMIGPALGAAAGPGRVRLSLRTAPPVELLYLFSAAASGADEHRGCQRSVAPARRGDRT